MLKKGPFKQYLNSTFVKQMIQTTPINYFKTYLFIFIKQHDCCKCVFQKAPVAEMVLSLSYLFIIRMGTSSNGLFFQFVAPWAGISAFNRNHRKSSNICSKIKNCRRRDFVATPGMGIGGNIFQKQDSIHTYLFHSRLPFSTFSKLIQGKKFIHPI